MPRRTIAAQLARNWITAFIDPGKLRGAIYLPRYFTNRARYAKIAGSGSLHWRESFPCINDWTTHTPFDAHYFYQGSWVARNLAALRPNFHVDIGSSVMMISILSAFVPTLFVDYRPLKANIPGMTSIGGNLVELPFASGSLHSLSCLHVIEHVGLGRYRDPIDPKGSVKAAAELSRVLAPGGHLLLSTPVGRERVQFNAHRVFAPTTVPAMFSGLEIAGMAFVDDQCRFHSEASPDQAADCEYACGMFDFIKKKC